MKANENGRKAIKAINSVVDTMVLVIVLALTAFAGYALWDSKQIYAVADKTQYEAWKPTVEDEGKSFKEFQSINPEVIAWLEVYGTGVDYPVTQAEDNMKYVNTNAEGLYALSGSVFLDCGNNKGFTDFNNILYGHHMEKKAMFGDIGSFSDRDMFNDHKYGNLYYDGKDHGLEFFAFVHADAYDSTIFMPSVKNEKDRQEYLDGLLGKAIHTRDVGVSIQDRIILLSTCSSSSTNGRDILVARITDEVFFNPFFAKNKDEGKKQFANGRDGFVKEITPWPLLLVLALLIRLGVSVYEIVRKRIFGKKIEVGKDYEREIKNQGKKSVMHGGFVPADTGSLSANSLIRNG